MHYIEFPCFGIKGGYIMKKLIKCLGIIILLATLTTIVFAESREPDASHTFPDGTKAYAYLTVTKDKATASTSGPDSVSQTCTIYYFNKYYYTYGSTNNGSGGYKGSGVTIKAPTWCEIQYARSSHTASNSKWGSWSTSLQKIAESK